MRLYYATNIKGGADRVTIKVTPSSMMEIYLTEYAGVNLAAPIDVQAGASGSSSSVSSGTATTTGAGDLIYGLCIGDSVCTVGPNFTVRSTFHSNVMEDKIGATAGSYAATATSNSGWTMQMVALRPAALSAPAITMAPPTSPAVVRAGSSRTVSRETNQVAAAPASSDNGVFNLSCAPKVVKAGGQATCEVRTGASSASQGIRITSSSAQVAAPASVSMRPDQTSLTFQVSADPAARQQSATVTAESDSTSVQDTIHITAASNPVMRLPSRQLAKPGQAVQFAVSASDPASPEGAQVSLAASGLPAGASFDSAGGRFQWTPAAGQIGKYEVLFTATSADGRSSSQPVAIEVGSGLPAIKAMDHLCSPGAIASLTGTWLAESGSDGAAATKVAINGQDAPVVSASAESVQFLCPVSPAGTQLDIAIATAPGTTAAFQSTMQGASPWIFTTESQDQNPAVVSFAGTAELAMARNALTPAHPAQPGDQLLIWGTGFGSANDTWVKLGALALNVLSLDPVAGRPGVYTIRVQVPQSAAVGDAVALQAGVTGPDGAALASNTVTIAVEPVRQ